MIQGMAVQRQRISKHLCMQPKSSECDLLASERGLVGKQPPFLVLEPTCVGDTASLSQTALAYYRQSIMQEWSMEDLLVLPKPATQCPSSAVAMIWLRQERLRTAVALQHNKYLQQQNIDPVSL